MYENLVWVFHIMCVCVSAEDHTNLDPAVLATLKKLQDGYFGGARWSVHVDEVMSRVLLLEI